MINELIISKLRSFIIESKHSECFDELLSELHEEDIKDHGDNLRVLQSRYKRITHEKLLNTIDTSEYEKNMAQITVALFSVISDLGKSYNLKGRQSVTDKAFISKISKELNFSQEVNFYLTGRTSAGKSTLSNKFLNVNKEGSFGTTTSISHSTFNTGLSIFDLPGILDNSWQTNINRIAIGLNKLPISDDYISVVDSKQLENAKKGVIEYMKYLSIDTDPIINHILLDDWVDVASKNKLSPDLILYVIRINKDQLGFTQPEVEYLLDLLKLLKSSQSLHKIVFVFNIQIENSVIEEQSLSRIKNIYKSLDIAKENLNLLRINAGNGEGFENLITQICLSLDNKKLGQIKNIFEEKYRNQIIKEQLKRFMLAFLDKMYPVLKKKPFENLTYKIDEPNFIIFFKKVIDELLKEEVIDIPPQKIKELIEKFNQIIESILLKLVIPKTKDVPKKTLDYKDIHLREDPYITESAKLKFEKHAKRGNRSKALEAIQDGIAWRWNESQPIYFSTTDGREPRVFSGLNDSYKEFKIDTYLRINVATAKIADFERAFSDKDASILFVYAQYSEVRRNIFKNVIVEEIETPVPPEFDTNGIVVCEALIAIGIEIIKIMLNSDYKPTAKSISSNLDMLKNNLIYLNKSNNILLDNNENNFRETLIEVLVNDCFDENKPL